MLERVIFGRFVSTDFLRISFCLTLFNVFAFLTYV